ncbi:hypothetical protein FRC07_000509 [Ceratobasidium sp. 392]|nr:hypothetical protein FRC07_000509 [Ceratobasidium sp. 392]
MPQQEDKDIEINALIYEVDEDYVFSDEEYLNILRSLRYKASRDERTSASARSQTLGAGPSHTHRSPKVTVEEETDEGECPQTRETEAASDKSNSSVVQGKGKDRAVKKKKKQRKHQPSLGVVIDDLKVDNAKAEKQKKTHQFDTSCLESTPAGFRSGG